MKNNREVNNMLPLLLGALAVGAGVATIVEKENNNTQKKNNYTTKEAAEILGISEYTVRKKIRDEELKAIKIPGEAGYRISKEELERYSEKAGKSGITLKEASKSTEVHGSLFDKNIFGIYEILNSPNETDITKEEKRKILEEYYKGKQNELKLIELKYKRFLLDKDEIDKEDEKSVKEFDKQELDYQIKIESLKTEVQALKINLDL